MDFQYILGPYSTIQLDSNHQANLYILPFDKQGQCQASQTREDLLAEVEKHNYSDIFIFSHGWNNDWTGAINLYKRFFQGYADSQFSHDRDYNPLFIGVFWPSIALVMPWKVAPQIAGPTTTSEEEQAIQEIASELNEDDVERFYELAKRKTTLNSDEALELARIMAPLYNASHDELDMTTDTPSAEELLRTWQAIALKIPGINPDGDFGFVRESFNIEPQPALIPQAIGITISLPLLHCIFRLGTVCQMKDRAGTVGAYGVGPLLRDLLTKNSTSRFHLLGHSYGCKVILSALCIQELPRPVHSVLLLQPAISHLCFAEHIAETGKPGGYRVALERVGHPILTTFSHHDQPLNRFFHLAVWRQLDLGEQQIAGPLPPSKYAALGGYGAGGCDADVKSMKIKPINEPYIFEPGSPKIWNLDSADAIKGHGDICNSFTYWALYNQVIDRN
jgi:hypothetical protein